jgi:hypothetical protein
MAYGTRRCACRQRRRGTDILMPQENQNQPLPVAKMDHFDFGGQRYRWDSKLFPLGGKQIIEGIAFVVERQYLQGLAPAQVGRLDRSVLSAPTAWHFALPLFLMQTIVGDAPADLVVKACEFALCLPASLRVPRRFIRAAGISNCCTHCAKWATRVNQGSYRPWPSSARRRSGALPKPHCAACQYADAQVAHNQDNNYGSLVKAYNLSHAASSAVLWRQRLERSSDSKVSKLRADHAPLGGSWPDVHEKHGRLIPSTRPPHPHRRFVAVSLIFLDGGRALPPTCRCPGSS